MRTLDVVVGLLLAYIGVRLLAPFGLAGQVAGVVALLALFALLPRGWGIRGNPAPWRVMLPWIAAGFFSWLFVLTLLRDVALGIAGMVLDPATIAHWTPSSALAVMALVPAITFIGFLMARQVAAV